MVSNMRFITSFFLFVLLGLVSCSSAPASPQVADTPAPEAGSGYEALDGDSCSALADTLANAVGVDVSTGDAPFDDYVNNEGGLGCQAAAVGTGQDFASPAAVVEAVSQALSAQGWAEDAQYAAGGPSGAAAGFSQGNDLCILQVSWEPTADADCPADQPLAACDLSPDQQLYTVDLNCATQ